MAFQPFVALDPLLSTQQEVELHLPELHGLSIRLVVAGERAHDAARRLEPTLHQINRIVSQAVPMPLKALPSDAGPREIIWQIRYLILLAVMTMTELVMIQPMAKFTALTFFAEDYGGGDCAVNPASSACRHAASFMAFIQGWGSAASSTVASFSAVFLGAISDSIGRRPLIQMKAVFSALPVIALALRVFKHRTMWPYFLADYTFKAFDTNGVMLAYISDSITDARQRSAATGLLVVCFVAGIIVCLPMAALAPPAVLIFIAACIVFFKLYYTCLVFPETLRGKKSVLDDDADGCREALSRALALITKNSTVARMMCVLFLFCFSLAGLLGTIGAYFTAYMGFDRPQLLGVFALVIPVAVVSLGIFVRPVLNCLGEVRALQACLLAVVAFPSLLTTCEDSRHVMLLIVSCCGPMFMMLPIVVGIKTSLAPPDDQGTMTGLLSSMFSLATAIADVTFGTLFHKMSGAEASSVHPLFYAMSACAGCAWLVSLTLPRQLPARRRFIDVADIPDADRNYQAMCVF